MENVWNKSELFYNYENAHHYNGDAGWRNQCSIQNNSNLKKKDILVNYGRVIYMIYNLFIEIKNI